MNWRYTVALARNTHHTQSIHSARPLTLTRTRGLLPMGHRQSHIYTQNGLWVILNFVFVRLLAHTHTKSNTKVGNIATATMWRQFFKIRREIWPPICICFSCFFSFFLAFLAVSCILLADDIDKYFQTKHEITIDWVAHTRNERTHKSFGCTRRRHTYVLCIKLPLPIIIYEPSFELHNTVCAARLCRPSSELIQ